MASKLVIALTLCAPSSAAVVQQKAFLANGMQPEVVARTLSNVEDEWKAQAGVFTECNSMSADSTAIVNCADAPSSFAKSCGTVVGAIIQGSGGDKDVAKEYMADVCGQHAISGWHQQQCTTLATAVQGAMSADKYVNRESFNTAKLCNSFWSRFLSEEQKRVAEEKAAHEAAEKKAAEEAAEADRVLQEKLKKEAEQKKVEDAENAKKKAEAEAAEAAAEAKAKAAEAAEKAAEKKVAAEKMAEAAKEKMAEAEAAENEHKKAVEAVPAAAEKAKAAPVAAKAVVTAPKEAVKALVATTPKEAAKELAHAYIGTEPVVAVAKPAAKETPVAKPAAAKPAAAQAAPAKK